jgi:sugar/nucleoside kinase (ribokinase family)
MDVVCLGILVADVTARPVDDVPRAGSLAVVDGITVEGGREVALTTGSEGCYASGDGFEAHIASAVACRVVRMTR